MKKLLLMFSLLTYGICDGQNLVPNPSFEDNVHCPIGFENLSYTTKWFNPSRGSPDYFNACATSSCGTPQNLIGYQNPRTGNAYAGLGTLLVTYDSVYNSFREYIEVKLDSSLQSGRNYLISFYVSLADSVNYATDDIGAYLSVDTIRSDTTLLLYATPQIENTQGNILTDKIGWTEISGVYTAQGGEQFLTIGNFKNYHNTDTVFVGGGFTSNGGAADGFCAYYYIDDVTVTIATGIDEQNQNENFFVFPNPFNAELNISVKENEQTEIILYDILSRTLLQKTFTNSTTLNTEQLAKGIYIYEVRNKNGVVQNGKVVKE